jgi:hypothetical protein
MKPQIAREPIDSTQGLHRIKDLIDLEFMGDQANNLLKNLDAAIKATADLAPRRSKNYRLKGGERSRLADPKKEVWSEKDWEQALWNNHEEIKGAGAAWMWAEIVGYQEPLQESRRSLGWGKIDLLGITELGLPVIIELKSNKKDETLLRALIEATAYGIALREAWPNLAGHWRKRAAELGLPSPSLNRLDLCPLVIAAPKDYWDGQKTSQNREASEPFADFWNPFHELCAALATRGLPVSFLKLKRSENGRITAERATLPAFQTP